MNTLLTAGESTEMNLYGPDMQTGERGGRVLHVVIHHHGTHIGLVFTDHGNLNRALPVDEARAYLADIKREAKSGTAVWAIEQLAGAWTSAAAIVDAAEQDMVTGINATLDAAQPKPIDVSDILADMPRAGSWNALKQANRRDYSRTRVSSKEPTAAELDRIRAHRDGIVTTAPGQPWTLLRAIVRRELGDIHEVHGRHVIASVRLNARGMALVGEHIGEAA